MEQSARRSFHIGRYHCTETLAQGPLGETFRAKVYGVAGLEKQYALKQIDAALRVEPEQRQRLVEAARRYATLEHDRIARLTEIHDDADNLFLVTELARGIDLPRLLAHLRARSETLPIEQAILIVADVADALEAARRPSEAAPQGVAHLGLHLGTVSVLSEGEVRVSDFAIGAALERPGWGEDDALSTMLAYVAPERVAGNGATAAADAWSVGALLFELCAGVPLLAGATAAELRAARSAPPWDKLPARAGLRELLDRLLAHDPSARPQTDGPLREALTRLLGLELTRARAGLQALVKRALGRTLTRTGSFATVAIASAGMPTLVQDAPAAPPANLAPRTLLGTVPIAQQPQPIVAPPVRGWTPPRPAAVLQAVRAPSPPLQSTTLQGLGVTHVSDENEPPQMELAELPPQAEGTVTERSLASVAFDEGVTSPQGLAPDEPILALETESLELELDVHEAPTESGAPPTPPPPPARPLPSVPPTASPVLPAPIALLLPPRPPMPKARITTPPTPLRPHSPPPMQSPSSSSSSSSEPSPSMSPSPSPSPSMSPSPSPSPEPRRGRGAWIVVGIVGLTLAAAIVVAIEQKAASPVAQHATTDRVRSTVPTTEPPPPEPQNAEAPKVEAPKVEAAKVEAPKVEAAKVEAPKVEAPKVEAPKVEAPKVEAPKVEAPKVEAPKVEAPKLEALKAEPALAGQLAVTTTPAGAAVWLDGELRGQTPLRTSAAAGKRRLIVVMPGLKLVQKDTEVAPAGASLELTLEPARLPAEVQGAGGLKVRCHTQGELRILVDGHDTGMTCPNADRIAVVPGTHKIGLVSPRTGEIHEIDGEVADDENHSTRIYVRY